jgi:hypothetical protein
LGKFSMRRGGVVGGRDRGPSHDGTFFGAFGINGLRGGVRGILTVGVVLQL